MRRFLPLLLCLLLALPLAACGEDPAADAVPMPTDGGEEAQIQLDPDDPLSNYLDLTQLDAQTAAGATQELNLTSENGGCQVVLQKAVGDAMTLHLSLEGEPTVSIQFCRCDGAYCLAVVDGQPTALVPRSQVVDLQEAVYAVVLGES